jgi:hypothetical protein
LRSAGMQHSNNPSYAKSDDDDEKLEEITIINLSRDKTDARVCSVRGCKRNTPNFRQPTEEEQQKRFTKYKGKVSRLTLPLKFINLYFRFHTHRH